MRGVIANKDTIESYEDEMKSFLNSFFIKPASCLKTSTAPFHQIRAYRAPDARTGWGPKRQNDTNGEGENDALIRARSRDGAARA